MDKVLVEYNSSNGIFFQHRILDRDYNVKPASHAHYEFVYLIKGKMKLKVNDQERILNSGELALIDANVMHAQNIFGGKENELMVISVLPSVLPSIVNFGFIRMVSDSPLLAHGLPAGVVSKYNIPACFKRICALTKKSDFPYKDLYISSEMIQLVACMSKAIDSLVSLRKMGDSKLNKTVLLSKCLDYLNTNLNKKISVEELAEKLCCSKSYLQHVFKKEMGLTISEYINTQKMSIAKSLLASKLSPGEVSEKLGYEYYSTFSTKFKKFYGVSPKDISVEEVRLNIDLQKIEEGIKDE